MDGQMHKCRVLLSGALVAFFLLHTGCSQVFRVDDNVQKLRQFKRLIFHRNPHALRDPSVEELAQEIDWLEHHIETFGTVVPKQPDVWGQARLTKYRQEIEKLLAAEMSSFSPTLQASIRRSDQSMLSMALAINSADTDAQTPPSISSNPAVTLIGTQGLLTSPTVNRTSPQSLDLSAFAKGDATKQPEISLEPTLYVDQMKRYLDHLSHLRRINNGDDNSDSPGYALHMVRIPISILSGKRTRKGYGAEITITAEPILGEELLPTTFRSLVVNDIVDKLTLAITQAVNQPEMKEIEGFLRKEMKKLQEDKEKSPENARSQPQIHDASFAQLESLPPPGQRKKDETYQEELNKINREFEKSISEMVQNITITAISGSRNRRAHFSFPMYHIPQVYGTRGIGHVAIDAYRALRNQKVSKAPVPNQLIHLMDVRGLLEEEVYAAYELLSQPENLRLWGKYSTPELARLIRNRNVDAVKGKRHEFYSEKVIENDIQDRTRTTTSLAWAIIVESALLNDRLIEDINELATRKGCYSTVDPHMPFFGPIPPPAAREAFNDYVRCRWPVQVFALDPATQDQNVADVFSRRRELQLAMAISVARGTMSGQAASRFARRLETDIQTIQLNRTDVGFSHGNDTFGWRFFPRVQTPPTPGTLQAFSETLGGGPTPDQDMRDRQLEPGIRECTAIVIMPSFVPYVTFHSRTNWFGLTNPRKKELTMHDTMKLSRSHQAIHESLRCLNDHNLYRPGDIARMAHVVEQLDRKMPLQSMVVQIPYENTLGGFEMFNSGVSDLGPELHGWYGAPGVKLAKCGVCDPCRAADPVEEEMTAKEMTAKEKTAKDEECHCRGTTVFLVGDNFSVQDTKVIAGGKCIPTITLLSRQVMQVTIPAGAHIVEYCEKMDGNIKKQYIDVHVATPYGVTNHLLIPVYGDLKNCPEAEKEIADP